MRLTLTVTLVLVATVGACGQIAGAPGNDGGAAENHETETVVAPETLEAGNDDARIETDNATDARRDDAAIQTMFCERVCQGLNVPMNCHFTSGLDQKLTLTKTTANGCSGMADIAMQIALSCDVNQVCAGGLGPTDCFPAVFTPKSFSYSFAAGGTTNTITCILP